ncbi:hypothetical protein KP509_11G067400 [Ceratopteris richardii]|uniref:Pentatricopeptide repeat-containing protein n=1 Tax=Ceratopteris richardii TaxID=49495 RepID=A0A8T2TZ19_CERRI|nr:hypothetical protein KP509_11G067400 [Ceratopteris richardii]
METSPLQRLILYHRGGKTLFRDSVFSFLQNCVRNQNITLCRILHCLVIFHELYSISSLGDHLIRFFGLYGHLLEANLAFSKVVQESTYTWEAIISAHVSQGQNKRALFLYDSMQMPPSKCVYLAVLRACITKESTYNGRLIHARIIRAELDSDLAIASSLIYMYAQCGELEDACKVFDEWAGSDVVMWNCMITAYTARGHVLSCLKLYEQMGQKGIEPDQVTYVSILKACAQLQLLREGWLLHNEIIRKGFDSNEIVGNILVDMYAKCKKRNESDRMFRLSCQNIVSWNTKISGCIQYGKYDSALDLFKKMRQQGLQPDKITFLSVIKACANLDIKEGHLIHSEANKQGIGNDLAVNNALIHMYAKKGNLEVAREIFDSLPCHDMVSWGAMVDGYVESGQHESAFMLVANMFSQGFKPEKVILLSLAKACSDIKALGGGQIVHHQIIEIELGIDNVVASTLMDMYAKCKCLGEAWSIFEKLSNRDVVAWSVMISGHVQVGDDLVAFDLFQRMQQEGVNPDKVTYLCLLKASGNLQSIVQGKQVHHLMMRNQLDLDIVVTCSLVDMYIKCGDLGSARQVFEKIPVHNEVSWSIIISGYLEHGQYLPALELFQKMIKEGFTPDKVMTLSILKAIGSIAAIGPGMVVHDQIIRMMVDTDVMVCNTLIDMYAKCGRIKEAHKVFEFLPNRDNISWNVIIAANALNENHGQVIQAFTDMKQEGLKPTESTFTSVLSSCCQAGKMDDVRQHFEQMIKDHAISPTVEHLNCIIDALGRAARFDDARHFIETMSTLPDITTWLSLLTACGTYKNVEFGRFCFNAAVQLDPNVAATYVLMSNLYANVNMWEDAHKIQLLQQQTCTEVSSNLSTTDYGSPAEFCCIDSDTMYKEVSKSKETDYMSLFN